MIGISVYNGVLVWFNGFYRGSLGCGVLHGDEIVDKSMGLATKRCSDDKISGYTGF